MLEKSEHTVGFHAYPDSIPLPSYIVHILRALESEGYESWVVGGYVRDAIMGRAATDIDVATAAHWKDVQRVCEAAGARTHETGVKHGTITVVMGDDACEVTTYRSDGAYTDARHPDHVEFVSTIEEDLARRDFTMNAIAYNPQRGFCDPYHGIDDIERGVIRAVGDAKKRFSEDALRILRACRFASQLGFAIDDASYRAMVSSKSLLSHISTERITHELDALLMGGYVHDALMRTVDVLAFVVPELVAMKDCPQVTKYHIYDVLEHTAWAVQHAPKDRLVRWAAFCHDMGKPASAFFDEDGVEHFYGHAKVGAQVARGLLERLTFSSAFRSDVVALIANHNDVIQPTSRNVKRALLRLDGNVDLFRKLIELKRADMLAHAPEFASQTEAMDEILTTLDELIAHEEAFCLKDLAINGNDLIAMGIEPGKKIGELLTMVLNEVIDGNLANEKTVLLDFCTTKL